MIDHILTAKECTQEYLFKKLNSSINEGTDKNPIVDYGKICE